MPEPDNTTIEVGATRYHFVGIKPNFSDPSLDSSRAVEVTKTSPNSTTLFALVGDKTGTNYKAGILIPGNSGLVTFRQATKQELAQNDEVFKKIAEKVGLTKAIAPAEQIIVKPPAQVSIVTQQEVPALAPPAAESLEPVTSTAPIAAAAVVAVASPYPPKAAKLVVPGVAAPHTVVEDPKPSEPAPTNADPKKSSKPVVPAAAALAPIPPTKPAELAHTAQAPIGSEDIAPAGDAVSNAQQGLHQRRASQDRPRNADHNKLRRDQSADPRDTVTKSGVKIRHNADGTETRISPDGMEVQTFANGTQFVKSHGVTTVIRADHKGPAL